MSTLACVSVKAQTLTRWHSAPGGDSEEWRGAFEDVEIFFFSIFHMRVYRRCHCCGGGGRGTRPLQTRLWISRLFCRMWSFTAWKTKRMLAVSVAQVKWE